MLIEASVQFDFVGIAHAKVDLTGLWHTLMPAILSNNVSNSKTLKYYFLLLNTLQPLQILFF